MEEVQGRGGRVSGRGRPIESLIAVKFNRTTTSREGSLSVAELREQ